MGLVLKAKAAAAAAAAGTVHSYGSAVVMSCRTGFW
jgi:hypothetical protein